MKVTGKYDISNTYITAIPLRNTVSVRVNKKHVIII